MSVVALEASSVKKVYTKNGQPLEILDVERFSVRDPTGLKPEIFLLPEQEISRY